MRRTALFAALIGYAVLAAAAHGTVWLCKPGLPRDPCLSDMTTSVVGPTGAVRVQTSKPARNPPIDCFAACTPRCTRSSPCRRS